MPYKDFVPSRTSSYGLSFASGRLIFEKDGVKLERRGDYALSLLLRQGEISEGALSFGESVGTIRVHAHKIGYSIGADCLLASLRYDLIFGEERQKMKLRLYVKKA